MIHRVSAIVLVLSACSEYGLQVGTDIGGIGNGEIEVSPLVIDFGALEVGTDSAPMTVQVSNVGRGLLQVESLSIEDSSFLLVEEAQGFDLMPDESRSFDVLFRPNAVGRLDGSLSVMSDDRDEPRVDVALSGRGTGPFLQITPEKYDFGGVTIPCPESVELVLQNVGDAPLTVSDMVWAADPQLKIAFTDRIPFELAPGAYSTANVSVDPIQVGAMSSTLTVISTDPRGDQVATQTAAPNGAGTKTDRKSVSDNPPVDLIVAVDRSASMEDDSARLGASFSSFIDELQSVTNDWRVGVVTLDSGCFNGGVITGGTKDYGARFASAVTTGEDRDIQDDEALFSLVDRALRSSTPGRCNEGFRRADAAFRVIVVSDEREQSADRVPTLTWDAFVGRWQAEVSSPSLLKVSGVVDIDGCGGGADGYVDAIEATDGLELSICGTDWSVAATQLAQASVDRVYGITLSEAPVVESLVVTLDGAEVDFVYDPATRTVVLESGGSGNEIAATYTIASECP